MSSTWLLQLQYTNYIASRFISIFKSQVFVTAIRYRGGYA